MRRDQSAMITGMSRRRRWRGAIAIGAVAAAGFAFAAPVATAGPAPTAGSAISYLPPNPASGLRVSYAVDCGSGVLTADTWPAVYATATDNNNPPLGLGLWFEVWDDATGTLKASNSASVDIASGTTGVWHVPVNLGDGEYSLRAAVENHVPPGQGQNLRADWSPWYLFTVRGTRPSQTPSITSSDYPPGGWGSPSDSPGTFTFNANGAPNIIGFTYTFLGAGNESIPTTTECDFDKAFGFSGGYASGESTATITVPVGLSVGPHTLNVRSIDDAHNLSTYSQTYSFFVSPPAQPTGAAPAVNVGR